MPLPAELIQFISPSESQLAMVSCYSFEAIGLTILLLGSLWSKRVDREVLKTGRSSK